MDPKSVYVKSLRDFQTCSDTSEQRIFRPTFSSDPNFLYAIVF